MLLPELEMLLVLGYVNRDPLGVRLSVRHTSSCLLSLASDSDHASIIIQLYRLDRGILLRSATTWPLFPDTLTSLSPFDCCHSDEA